MNRAAGSAASLALAPLGRNPLAVGAAGPSLLGRFLTHVSVVRVNQIEVTPSRSIGEDEAPDNSPDQIRSRREAFLRGCPKGKMTWAISWLALNDTRSNTKMRAACSRPITSNMAMRSPSSRAVTSHRCTTPVKTSG